MHAGNEIGEVRSENRFDLTLLAEQRLREALRQRTPSEPWIDAQFVEVQRTDERGRPMVRRIHDPAVFPPGGAKTGMVRCALCGIFNPPNAMEGGNCLDHREDCDWGPSPSAVMIETYRFYHRKLKELDLDSESTPDLIEEISRYRRLEEKAKRKDKNLPRKIRMLRGRSKSRL